MKKIKHVERKESKRNLNVSKCDRTECFVEKLYFFLKYPLKEMRDSVSCDINRGIAGWLDPGLQFVNGQR